MCFRNDQKENIQRLLSEEARTRRSHNYKYSLQLSVISWSIEFVTGCLILIDYSLEESNNTFYFWWYVHPLVDIFLTGVVIPSAYVLKSDLFREFLYNFGWLRTIRKLLGAKESRVDPNDEESRVTPSDETWFVISQKELSILHDKIVLRKYKCRYQIWCLSKYSLEGTEIHFYVWIFIKE